MSKPGNEPLREFINALWADRNEVISSYLVDKEQIKQNKHSRKQKEPAPE